MVLTRTVIRELSDGNQIVVTRRFRIRFEANDQGYRIEGTQIGVEVAVPPILDSMADMERNRVESGVFPLQLNQQGILLDQTGQPVDPAFSQEMEIRGSAIINRADIPAEERSAGIRSLSRLTKQGTRTPWPADLFTAAPGERRQQREVPLSDGRLGKVEVVLRVDGLLSCGLPKSFERVVITELPGSRMVSREIYTLADLAE
jgi:hypothetical protein